jgi:arylsulfatase A-like enzyme
MSKPLRTNPAFAHLAYEKAITTRIKVFLRRTYLGDEQSKPRETLVCEEVFPIDAHIPQESIQHYIEQLSEKEADLDRQLKRFELVAPHTQGRHETQSKVQKGPTGQDQKGGRRHHKGFRAS